MCPDWAILRSSCLQRRLDTHVGRCTLDGTHSASFAVASPEHPTHGVSNGLTRLCFFHRFHGGGSPSLARRGWDTAESLARSVARSPFLGRRRPSHGCRRCTGRFWEERWVPRTVFALVGAVRPRRCQGTRCATRAIQNSSTGPTFAVIFRGFFSLRP